MNLGIPMPQLKNKINLQDLLSQQAQQMPQEVQPIQDVQSTEPVVQESGKMGTMQKIALVLAAVAAAKGKTNPLQMMLAQQIGQGDARRQKVQDDIQNMLAKASTTRANTAAEKAQWQKVGKTLLKNGVPVYTAPMDVDFEVIENRIIAVDPNTKEAKEVTPEGLQAFAKAQEDAKVEKAKVDIAEGKVDIDLKKSQIDVNKQRLDTDKARIQNWKDVNESRARRDAISESKARGYNMTTSQQTELTDMNWVIDLTQEIEDDLSDKELQSFIGSDLGAWFKRGTKTEYGSWFWEDTPPKVVDFLNKIGQLRDIVQRSRTGAAMPETERVFYEDLIGGKQYSPQALTQKLKSTRGIFSLGKDKLFQTVDTSKKLKTGESTITESGKVVPGKSAEVKPETGTQQPTKNTGEKKYQATPEQKAAMTMPELREYVKTGIIPERIKNLKK